MVPKTCKFLALVLTMTVVILSWWIARYCHQRLPTPVDNTQHNFRFVEKNARVSLVLLIDYCLQNDKNYSETPG